MLVSVSPTQTTSETDESKGASETLPLLMFRSCHTVEVSCSVQLYEVAENRAHSCEIKVSDVHRTVKRPQPTYPAGIDLRHCATPRRSEHLPGEPLMLIERAQWATHSGVMAAAKLSSELAANKACLKVMVDSNSPACPSQWRKDHEQKLSRRGP
jgi:hypothetical protein